MRTPPASSAAALDHATLLAAVAPTPSPSEAAARRDAVKAIAAQVYRVVAAVLGPASADVGDASQEAFMRVYKAIPTFRADPLKPSGARAWVNQIALNAALDRLKSQRSEIGSRDDTPIEGVSIDDPEGALDRKRLVRLLFETLDERERAVLVLKYWSGETDDEISATLGLPLGTVKSRLRYAAEKLRRGLTEPATIASALVTTPQARQEVKA